MLLYSRLSVSRTISQPPTADRKRKPEAMAACSSCGSRAGTRGGGAAQGGRHVGRANSLLLLLLLLLLHVAAPP